MERMKIAQMIALVATALTVLGLVLEQNGVHNGGVLCALGVVVGLVAYIFGGLGKALSMTWGIGKWGFLFGPFPANLAIGLMSIIWAGIVLLFLPIIPVRKAYKESMGY